MNRKEKKTEEKIMTRRRIFCYILIILFIFLLCSSVTKILLWSNDNKYNKKLLDEISNYITINNYGENSPENKYAVNFSELKNLNKNTVAWLKVNGTEIEFPVVKAKDNDYYLSHSFDKSTNPAGWIFMDYRNKIDGNDKNIIIYGHNRRDGSMFGSLKKILNEEWYNNEENRKIVLATETEECIYEVFSIYKIEKEDYYIQTEFTDYEEFINTIKARSIKDFNMPLDENIQILTLSTCDNDNRYRIVLHAKKILSKF